MKKPHKKSRKKLDLNAEELFLPEDEMNVDELSDSSEEHDMMDDGEDSFIDPANVIRIFNVKP